MDTSAEMLQKTRVPEMDNILGVVFPVLDKGHIRVIDYMGSDEAIVQAARVSYGKGTKTVSEDRGLIRYLMRHRHTTPFEMCELKLHVKVPMDHWRQWIRHRTASVNEYSTRYSEAIDERQETLPGEWRFQSGSNKQGSGDFLPVESEVDPRCDQNTNHVESCSCKPGGKELSEKERDMHSMSAGIYEERLGSNVAREQARKDLPLSTYTEAYWKIDLHNLLHFLSLRMDAHAQKEIRDYANVIGNEIVAKWVPHTWEAFVDYRRHSVTLSRLEVDAIFAMLYKRKLDGDVNSLIGRLTTYGWMERKDGSALKPNRERMEFFQKAQMLGLDLEDTVENGFTLSPPPAEL